MHTAQILGRLTRDPELRSLPDGTPVCDLRLAVDGMGRGTDAGFIDVTVFGTNAENQVTYLAKGREVAVAGDLRFNEYEAGGTKRSEITLVARTVTWTRGKRREDNDTAPEGSDVEAGADA